MKDLYQEIETVSSLARGTVPVRTTGSPSSTLTEESDNGSEKVLEISFCDLSNRLICMCGFNKLGSEKGMKIL